MVNIGFSRSTTHQINVRTCNMVVSCHIYMDTMMIPLDSSAWRRENNALEHSPIPDLGVNVLRRTVDLWDVCKESKSRKLPFFRIYCPTINMKIHSGYGGLLDSIVGQALICASHLSVCYFNTE